MVSLIDHPIGESMHITTGRYPISMAHGMNLLKGATVVPDQSPLNPEPAHQRYQKPLALPPIQKAVEPGKFNSSPHQKTAFLLHKTHIGLSLHLQ